MPSPPPPRKTLAELFASLPPRIRNPIADEARGGIVDPVPVRLGPGVRLFRVVDRQPDAARQDARISGPWWIAECDYLRIVAEFMRLRGAAAGRRAQRQVRFVDTYREANAVPHRWVANGRPGRVAALDVIGSADVVETLWALMGQGKSQPEVLGSGLTRTWPGWPDLTQLFVYELSKHATDAMRRACARRLRFGAPSTAMQEPTMYREGPRRG